MKSLLAVLGQLIVNVEIGNPGIFGEAVALVLGGVNIRFQMHAVFRHTHALGHAVHLDPCEVIGDDLHPILHHRFANVEFLHCHRRNGDEREKREKENQKGPEHGRGG